MKKCIDCELEKETSKCQICNREVCEECSDENDAKHRLPINGRTFKLGNIEFVYDSEYKIICSYCASEYYKIM